MPPISAAAVVDAVLRADGGCASRCDAPAIVRALSEMGATDAEGLELLVRQCRAELTAGLSSVVRLRLRQARPPYPAPALLCPASRWHTR